MTKITTEYLLSILTPNFELNRRGKRSPYLECDAGWNDIIADLHTKLAMLYPNYSILQIKEKLGGLRFYTGSVSDEIHNEFHNIIGLAEELSYRTCEACGAKGTMCKREGWIKTLCRPCFDVWSKDSENCQYGFKWE